MDDQKLDELCDEVIYREKQLSILYDLLIRSDCFIYPILHLFGLSGTGKSYTIRKFLKKFCEIFSKNKKPANKKRVYVYLNCKELCYGTTSLLFSEILKQISESFASIDVTRDCDIDIDMEIEKEDPIDLSFSGELDQQDEDLKMNDFSSFLRQLKRKLDQMAKRPVLYLVFDNAE
ncbi:hypothetical protein BpHYR1_014022, partial [Brachionus plicatilis]